MKGKVKVRTCLKDMRQRVKVLLPDILMILLRNKPGRMDITLFLNSLDSCPGRD